MTLTTMQETWCDGCVPGECVYGPCAKPTPDPVDAAVKLGMQQVGAGNGLTMPAYPGGPQVSIKLDVGAPRNAPMDSWRIDNLEDVLLRLAQYENYALQIRYRYGESEPWSIRYGDWGSEVRGRDLRDTLDYCITMLRETIGSYEGGDEEEDEEDSEPF